MTRIRNTAARYGLDLACLAIAFFGAFLLRFDIAFDMRWFERMIVHLPFVLIVECACMALFGATRGAWRFVSISDVRRIVLALSVAQVPLCIERIIVGMLYDSVVEVRFWIMPIGVIFINLFLSVILCSGVRVLRRMVYEQSRRGRKPAVAGERVLLVGSAASSRQMIEAIRLHPEMGYEIVGVISDNPENAGRDLSGFPFLGTVAQIPDLAPLHHVTQAIITQPDTRADDLRRILDACAAAALKTRIVPRMNALISGEVDIAQMREISVEDLLHRDPVTLDKDEISKFLAGRRILITGAGGSIGSELCRQVLAFHPTELILVEQCELFLYEIERELRSKSENVKIIPRLVDICDVTRVEAVFQECQPEVIFHAAAYKHVPMLEYNPGEAIRNNVEGTATVAEAAVKHRVQAFVMISTDKAVNPTSVMGTSKRIAELYIQGMSAFGVTRFCAVRFGNVLGSTGSVLPLFRQQIAQGGPLTVTHADMVRYFMTIPEASQLVMQAATMARNGEIFVLDMGKPVKMVDLARDLIRLSGKTERDIPIVFSGPRPGEKLFEELGFNEEHMDRTQHPKIYVGKLQPVDIDAIRAAIEKLKPFRDSQDNAAVRAAMHEIVPEMQTPIA